MDIRLSQVPKPKEDSLGIAAAGLLQLTALHDAKPTASKLISTN